MIVWIYALISILRDKKRNGSFCMHLAIELTRVISISFSRSDIKMVIRRNANERPEINVPSNVSSIDDEEDQTTELTLKFYVQACCNLVVCPILS